MRFNPRLDPFVEAGYFGYSLRGVAHRQRNRSFRPSLEIRDYRYGEGEILYEHAFSECFGDADTAIARALGKGRRVIDDLLESMNRDEWIEI